MFSCKYVKHYQTAASVFMINNLRKPGTGKVILNHLIGNTRPEFRNGDLGSYFFKLIVESSCLELYFWAVALKIILTQ